MKCGETRDVTPETWPYRKRGGVWAAFGGRCLVCEKARKAQYEKRRDKIAALVVGVPAVPLRERGAEKTAQRDAVNHSRLDVAKALRAGSRVLNEYAPSVLSRVVEYAEDPESEHHRWALELLAERILPRKLYEELGGEAAGVGAIGEKRPQYVIQILPAQPGNPEGRVIDGGSTEPPQTSPE